MVIYPNSDCAGLCYWMLNVSRQRLTSPQITVTNNILNAYLGSTYVTEEEWNNFNLFAQWRNPYYLVYRDYQNSLSSSLLTDLVSYYEFAGNLNDSHGSENGTNSGLIFGGAYGILGNGVTNSPTTGYGTLGATSSFSFVKNTCDFTINVWVKSIAAGSSLRLINSNSSVGSEGLYWLIVENSYIYLTVGNDSGSPYTLVNVLNNKVFGSSQWIMYTLQGDGTYFRLYMNSELVARTQVGTLATGNDINPYNIFRIPSGSTSSQFYMCELGIWQRGLNNYEISRLYNSGAGLAYSNF